MTARIVLKSAIGMALATVIGSASVGPAHAAVVVSFTFGDIGAELNGSNPTNSTLITVSSDVGTFPDSSDPTHSLFVNSDDTTGLPHGNGTLGNSVNTSIAAFPLSPGAVNFYKDWENATGSVYYQVDFTSLALTSTPTATGYTGTYSGELYSGTGPSSLTDTGEKDTLAISIVDNGGPISVEFSDHTVPEPMSMAVFGIGILGLGLARRLRAGSKPV